MKKLKSIIHQLAEADHENRQDLNKLLWEFICYSPQWPLRMHQQELLDEAEKFTVSVYDEHFSKSALNVNGFNGAMEKTRSS